MFEETKPKSEAEFFREELWQLIRGRYGNLTCYETLGVLDYVRHGVMHGMESKEE